MSLGIASIELTFSGKHYDFHQPVGQPVTAPDPQLPTAAPPIGTRHSS